MERLLRSNADSLDIRNLFAGAFNLDVADNDCGPHVGDFRGQYEHVLGHSGLPESGFAESAEKRNGRSAFIRGSEPQR